MTDDPFEPRSLRKRAVLAVSAVIFFAFFTALGIWQLERREWKHSLIEAVEQRAYRDPVPAPGAAQWPLITAEADAYRRVTAQGRFLHDRETLVQAVTDQGGGFWVLTPLQTADFVVLVNRGFVPPDRSDPAARPLGNGQENARVTGLLRITEPGGGFLRDNDPAGDRWFSRDVAAIAHARGLGDVAPYFIDADHAENAGDYPTGGMTVVSFSDNHLVYALTWFALAGMALWAAWHVLAEGRRPRDKGA